MIRKCWDTINGNEEDEYIIFNGFTNEFVCFVKAKKKSKIPKREKYYLLKLMMKVLLLVKLK